MYRVLLATDNADKDAIMQWMWEKKSHAGLGALKRTRTGVTNGCQDASEVLYGSASAHPTLSKMIVNKGDKEEVCSVSRARR